jgi:hypothetical protein
MPDIASRLSSGGLEGLRFVFPRDEGLIQAEFEKTLPFSL